MSITESDLAKSSAEQRAISTDSAGNLVAVAIGWWLLATMGVSFVVEFLDVFFTKVPLGLDSSKWPASARTLQADIVVLGMCSVFLISARTRGRKVGHGDVRLGNGDNPMANLAMIVAMAIAAAAYSMLVQFVLHRTLSEAFSAICTPRHLAQRIDVLSHCPARAILRRAFLQGLAVDRSSATLGLLANGRSDWSALACRARAEWNLESNCVDPDGCRSCNGAAFWAKRPRPDYHSRGL
jgi:hypothetical protein